MTGRGLTGFLVAVLPLLLPACSPRPPSTPPPPESVRHEELASGRITLTLDADPATVALERPLFLTLTLSAPETVSAAWPALDDRFEGFDVAGSYEAGSRVDKGRVQRDLRVRLNPFAAPEYRLKPMALSYYETNAPHAVGWIKTKPVVFETDPLPPAADLQPPAPPLPVKIAPREIALAGLILVGVLLAGVLLVRLSRRLVKTFKLRQMSPRQRALLELDDLIGRHLIEKGLVKEFYFELTLVVRRYIERGHGIRAPEQTTEEFLISAGGDPRFPRQSLEKLQTFLTAADWVKYADYHPTPEAVPQALATARSYLDTDSAEAGKEGG